MLSCVVCAISLLRRTAISMLRRALSTVRVTRKGSYYTVYMLRRVSYIQYYSMLHIVSYYY